MTSHRGHRRPRPDREADVAYQLTVLHHLIAVLTWDSEEEFAVGFGSPEGRAALADVPNFATGGPDIASGPVRQYV